MPSNIDDITVFGAGISRWRLHPQFLFAHFLAYHVSCRVTKSGVFGTVKSYFTST